jgi:hypothetical protein
VRASRGAARTEFVTFFISMATSGAIRSTGSGDGALFNGGRAHLRPGGVGVVDGAGALGRGALPVRLAYTFTQAEFRSSSRVARAVGTVETGDELSYVPRHQLFASIEPNTGHGAARWRGCNACAPRRGRAPTPENTESSFVVNLSRIHPD